MEEVHGKCVENGEEKGRVNCRKGANIAGFMRVADVLVSCGNI